MVIGSSAGFPVFDKSQGGWGSGKLTVLLVMVKALKNSFFFNLRGSEVDVRDTLVAKFTFCVLGGSQV